jgi:hypothetical protein
MSNRDKDLRRKTGDFLTKSCQKMSRFAPQVFCYLPSLPPEEAQA